MMQDICKSDTYFCCNQANCIGDDFGVHHLLHFKSTISKLVSTRAFEQFYQTTWGPNLCSHTTIFFLYQHLKKKKKLCAFLIPKGI